jgi:hypothetical protein
MSPMPLPPTPRALVALPAATRHTSSVAAHQPGRRASLRAVKRFTQFAVALLMASAGVAVTPSSAHAAACGNVYIDNAANGLTVSAELGYSGSRYGELRARATTLGPWEKFTLCYVGSSTTVFTLRSQANGLYVSNEEGYGGDYRYMLRARATSVGPWEEFTMHDPGADLHEITASNGAYVTAELSWTGTSDYAMLHANRSTADYWEKWMILPF